VKEPLILVVDDEEHVALCATMFLKRAGYRTLRAASGEQGLQMFTDDVDAVLTDCAMPGLSGDKLAAQLIKRKPSLRVLFMSGNEADSVENGFRLEPGVNFIQKPFSGEQLVAFIIQALADKQVAVT
jgi:two-component system, cell cycle sensor histidine kinase and response regulator CckA